MKENEKKDKYTNFARELKKMWNMKVTVISLVNSALGTITEGFIKRLEDLEIRETSEDRPNYSIVEISQNTEKSPGELRRFVITQTLGIYHQITLM